MTKSNSRTERSSTEQKSQPLAVRHPAKARTIRVPLEDIDRSDMRFQFRLCMKTADLVDSIREQGQHTPIMLWGDRPPYIVVDGFRRLEVLASLCRTHANAILQSGLSESEAASLSFSANVERKNLSAHDKASVIWCALNRWGLTQAEVAEAFNLSLRQIERYASLLKFPDSIVRGVCEGRITMAHAVYLHQARAEDLEHWVEEVARHKLSAVELRRRLRGRRRRQANYFVRDSSGFRLRPIRFRHDMSAAERRRIASALENALRTAAESLHWESRRQKHD